MRRSANSSHTSARDGSELLVRRRRRSCGRRCCSERVGAMQGELLEWIPGGVEVEMERSGSNRRCWASLVRRSRSSQRRSQCCGTSMLLCLSADGEWNCLSLTADMNMVMKIRICCLARCDWHTEDCAVRERHATSPSILTKLEIILRRYGL